MTERSVQHATFSVERRYEVSPARVFAAWADQDVKARWFIDPDGPAATPKHELEFRPGGHELNVGDHRDGSAYEYHAYYWEIVPDERIVYSYEMLVGGTRISVSLATVELTAEGDGTRLKLTEQAAFFDDRDAPDRRRQGSGALLDALAEELERD
jgi:uncharacterized protein YndB with AHSA1/START domain